MKNTGIYTGNNYVKTTKKKQWTVSTEYLQSCSLESTPEVSHTAPRDNHWNVEHWSLFTWH